MNNLERTIAGMVCMGILSHAVLKPIALLPYLKYERMRGEHMRSDNLEIKKSNNESSGGDAEAPMYVKYGNIIYWGGVSPWLLGSFALSMLERKKKKE